MAKLVFTSSLSHRYTGGEAEFEVEAKNIRAALKALEARFPGLSRHVEDEMGVAVDGQLFEEAYLQPLTADSEVYFIPKIGAG